MSMINESRHIWDHYYFTGASQGGTCDTCGEQGQVIAVLNHGTVFNGDDEQIAEVCLRCKKNRRLPNLIVEGFKKWAEREDKRQQHFIRVNERHDRKERKRERKAREALEEAGHRLRELTPYQIRIDDFLDIYPTSGRYHNIRKNERGSYAGWSDIFNLVKRESGVEK